MRSLKRIFAILFTSVSLLSTSIVANAETNNETIQNSKNKLQQNAALINQKETEKENITKELQNVKNDLASIENEVTNNKANLAAIEQKVSETKTLIEKKKEEIVVLEDKVLARKGIMKERLISLQHTDQTNFIIDIIINSESFADLVNRATAVSTVLNADKDLLEQQKQDLKKIEEEKAEIDKQEKVLDEQSKSLASTQAALEQNLQKRQAALTDVQEKYNTILNEISLAETEKTAIQAKLNQAQASLAQEQQEASARAQIQTQTIAQQSESAAASGSENTSTNSTNNSKELYVTATAYSHEETTLDITSSGYNIRENSNMKLIAVDPSVIPLGSKVWVEGYGEAIAGDTGGAIKGHRIDVLMPSSAAAKSWGRRTVKVVILN